MRDMTTAELKTWQLGEWPCGCGTLKELGYMEGPRGGVTCNIMCPRCNMGLNVVDPKSGHGQFFGQVLREPAGYTPPKDGFALALKTKLNRLSRTDIILTLYTLVVLGIVDLVVYYVYRFAGIGFGETLTVITLLDCCMLYVLYALSLKET